jgi:hypothetical protein
VAGFDTATAVRRRAGDDVHASYAVELDPAWRIGTKPNGGYLLAVRARAAVDAVDAVDAGSTGDLGHPDPTAISAHFLAAPDAGPAQVDVEVLRVGRSVSQVRASLLADGRRSVEALVTCGRLPAAAEPWWSGVPAPPFPAEESCVLAPHDSPAFPVPLLKVVQERLDPATAGFAEGRPSGRAEIRGWVRLADGRAPDPLALLVAADCLPPATFELGLTGSWVPTIELTVYVRAVPAPGPLRAQLRARLVSADRVDEQCDVWDSTGHLVATSHQLAAIRLPEGHPPPTSPRT